ncbi:hypothetical protein As57867_014833, partial [Aphanomyces stellatus]
MYFHSHMVGRDIQKHELAFLLSQSKMVHALEELPRALEYYYLEHAGNRAGLKKNAPLLPVPSLPTLNIPSSPSTDDGVPRMKLQDLTWKNKARFNALMEKHSFIVLTDLGSAVESLYTDVRAAMQSFFESDLPAKTACTSKHIYRNENKTPMWYAGYETTRVRQCFRGHAGDLSRMMWPDAAFETKWRALLKVCQIICDKSLSLTMGYTVDGAAAQQAQGADLSVCYAFHYLNEEGTGQSEDENVLEHIDPSLYVIEP